MTTRLFTFAAAMLLLLVGSTAQARGRTAPAAWLLTEHAGRLYLQLEVEDSEAHRIFTREGWPEYFEEEDAVWSAQSLVDERLGGVAVGDEVDLYSVENQGLLGSCQVRELQAVSRGCSPLTFMAALNCGAQADFALPGGSPQPTFYSAEDPPQEGGRRLRNELRTDPTYATMLEDARSFAREDGYLLVKEQTRLQRYSAEGRAPITLLSGQLFNQDEVYCGWPWFEFAGVVGPDGDTTLHDAYGRRVQAVVDLDNDGQPELLERSRYGEDVALTNAAGDILSQSVVYSCVCGC